MILKGKEAHSIPIITSSVLCDGSDRRNLQFQVKRALLWLYNSHCPI